jgi:hypothetical protein
MLPGKRRSGSNWGFASLTVSRHNWGADALALDPQNGDVVYAALGMYTNSWYVQLRSI